MKYARIPRPGPPREVVTAGIDWASAGHAVCIVDAAGVVVSRFAVAHTAEGLKTLVSRLARAGTAEVAIERGDGPVVDVLLAAGMTVVVITPRQVKNLRSRYGSAGNKDDRLRRLRAGGRAAHRPGRLRPLIPDSPATVTLRQACRARQDLVRHRVAVTATEFCDSAGVRALVCAHERAAAAGSELRLALGDSPAARITQLIGLDQIVPLYRDVQQSLAPRNRPDGRPAP